VSVKVNKDQLLRDEMQRLSLVLRNAPLEQYERVVAVLEWAIAGMPDELPDWDDSRAMTYRITTNTDTARVAPERAESPAALPLSASFSRDA